MRLLLTGSFVVMLGGCSLLVDTDGISGGTLRGDGAPPVSVDAGGGGDGGDGPATSTPDGGDGGPVSGDAGGASPCDQPHRFCDDFDVGDGDPSSRWDSLVVDGATFGIDSSDAVSPSRSLKTALLSGSGSRTSFTGKKVTLSSQDATVGFDMRMDPPSSSDFGDIDWVQISILPDLPGGTSRYVILNQYGSDAAPRLSFHLEGASDVRTAVNPPVKTETWQHLTLHLTYGASPKASLSVDGAFAGVVAIDPTPMTAIEVRFGFDTAEAKVTQTVRYDNVTVDEL